MVTLRKEVAEQLGIEPGDEMEVGHEPEATSSGYRPAEEF
jgi:pheromone shutdown protein TraB